MKNFIKKLLRDYVNEQDEIKRMRWTKDEVQKVANNFTKKIDFKINEPSAYRAAKNNGWIDEVTQHMVQNKRWTKDEVQKIANKYNKKSDFKKLDPVAYSTAWKQGWLEDVTKHMAPALNSWTKDAVEQEALKYNTRVDFRKNSPNAYSAAIRNNWMEDVAKHMSKSKTAKSNTNIFIERAKDKFGGLYDYSDVKYTKSNEKIKIICPIHGPFFITPNHHLGGQGCTQCGRETLKNKLRIGTEKFIERANQIHNGKYDYSLVKYIDGSTPVEIICPIHGVFLQKPLIHTNLAGGCQKCSGNKKGDNQSFIENSKEIHGDKYDYSLVNYRGSHTKVKIVCPVHGEFEQTPTAHIGQKQGCPDCGRMNISKKLTLSRDNFINMANKVHNNKFDYSHMEYVNRKTPVKILCPNHGEFFQQPKHHLKGGGCPICQESRGEKYLSALLTNFGIKFGRQKKFIDCTNNQIGRQCRRLPFDFYLPKYNTVIEYDGIQHFQAVSHFGGEQTFLKRQILDNIKSEYAKSKNINLIRIPYTMKKEDIPQYIKSRLGIE